MTVGPYSFLLHSFVHSIHQVWHGHPQGLLFHAREYPAQNNGTFPYNLGFCQAGTPLAFDGAAMDHRNILYCQVCALAAAVWPAPLPCRHAPLQQAAAACIEKYAAWALSQLLAKPGHLFTNPDMGWVSGWCLCYRAGQLC